MIVLRHSVQGKAQIGAVNLLCRRIMQEKYTLVVIQAYIRGNNFELSVTFRQENSLKCPFTEHFITEQADGGAFRTRNCQSYSRNSICRISVRSLFMVYPVVVFLKLFFILKTICVGMKSNINILQFKLDFQFSNVTAKVTVLFNTYSTRIFM